jgi:hypothetical protein
MVFLWFWFTGSWFKPAKVSKERKRHQPSLSVALLRHDQFRRPDLLHAIPVKQQNDIRPAFDHPAVAQV